MKGVIISFDALLGLAALFFLIIVINSNLAGIEKNPFADTYLRELTLDAATVLEKSGKLSWTVAHNDSSRVRQFFNQLPNAVCMDVQFFNSVDLNTAAVTVSRDGCESSPDEVVSINRSFLVRQDMDANYFVARFNSWRQG